jgi:CubicO group peptidase (beta-lactamase class C family)
MKLMFQWSAPKLLTVVLGALGCLLLTNCTPFAQNILRYQEPGIEDHQIFPARVVEAGTPQPWKLAGNYNKTTPEDSLLKTIENYGTVAYLVIQNGELLYERYWADHNAKTYSASFSMAKSIVSMLVGIALEEGKIRSLDQAVADFIPEFKADKKASITLRHLLTMTSGLDWDESYNSIASPTAQLYYGDDLRSLVTNLTVKHPAGSVWYYSSADTQILGMALEAAIDKTLSQYASEKIWKHIGAEQNATWSLDKDNGTTKGNCCFNSTPRDFARLGQLVLQNGKWQNQQLVPSAYLATATKTNPTLKDADNNKVDYYGYQFWLGQIENKPMPFFAGILGQYIFVIPHLNAVIIRLGQNDNPGFQDVPTYVQAALKILKNK